MDKWMSGFVSAGVDEWMIMNEYMAEWISRRINKWLQLLSIAHSPRGDLPHYPKTLPWKMINVTCWTWHKLERRADEWCKLLSFLVSPVAAVLLSNSEPWMNQGLRSVRPQTAKGGLWGSDEEWHWNMITSKWGVSLHRINSWLTMAEVNDFVIVECM